MAEELRECPKCGGINLRIRTGATATGRDGREHHARVECRDCPDPDWPGITNDTADQAGAAAIAEWNRRAALPGEGE
jgi:hypothetical protein